MNSTMCMFAKIVAGSCAAAILFAGPLMSGGYLSNALGNAGIFSEAHAQSADGEGRREGAADDRQGGQGKGGAGAQGGRAGMSRVLEADDGSDDSDRPEWAGGEKELNPHRGDPNPSPGDTKGDIYGDLYVVVRDPVTGAPILVDGEYQICLDAACTETELTVDGEVPEGVTAVEVEFGRASVVRSPDRVTDNALDELLSKLTAATSVTMDLSGRLVIDGATVDSPIENLALYIALMTDDPKLTESILDKLPADKLELAASLLAGGADKTGTITIDFVVYQNVIMGITENDEYFNYDAFVYDRSTYDVTYDYNYQSGDEILSATVNLKDYLDATQPALEDSSGVTLFAIAADDALEVIEVIHSQIQDSLLPGTVTP